MLKKIEKILPGYAFVPLLSALLVNMAVYVGVAQLRGILKFYSLELPIDRKIPFVAPFVLCTCICTVGNQLYIDCTRRKRILLSFCDWRYSCKSNLFFLFFILSYNACTARSKWDRFLRMAGTFYLSDGCSG